LLFSGVFELVRKNLIRLQDTGFASKLPIVKPLPKSIKDVRFFPACPGFFPLTNIPSEDKR